MSAAARPPEDLDVWVLAGQSNMQGAGLLRLAPPPDDRVWCFSSAGRWGRAEEPLHRPWESFTAVHAEILRPKLPPERRGWTNGHLAREEARQRTTGVGPGLSFGMAMADALGRPVGLIPAAHGGTKLAAWSPDRRGEGDRSLYGAMLRRIERAGGTLRGILWYQGESDANDGEVSAYAERFDAWIAAVRADTGRADLPVVAVQIGRVVRPGVQGTERAWETLRETLRTLPQRTPHTAVTSAVDLCLADTLHLETPGQLRLGRRLARLALHLAGADGGGPNPQPRRLEARPQPGGLGRVCVACDHVRGGWQPPRHVPGFEVRTPDGKPHPVFAVIEGFVEPDQPAELQVLLNLPPDRTARLGYGLGLSPHCVAADAADMPLPAFAPRAIEGV